MLAGVNAGANLGVDVFMSGTVAAVREGALLGLPGIAFSHYRTREGVFDWGFAADTVGRVMERILAGKIDPGLFWNVNLPDLSAEKIGRESVQPRKLGSPCPELIDCSLGRGHLPVEFARHHGALIYQGVYQDRPRESGDDVDVCFGGNVAVTKMSIW